MDNNSTPQETPEETLAGLKSNMLAQLKLLRQEFKKRQADLPDVYLMTFASEDRLKDYINKKCGGYSPYGTYSPVMGVFGTPYEAYPTLFDCWVRYKQLQEQGRKPLIITE